VLQIRIRIAIIVKNRIRIIVNIQEQKRLKTEPMGALEDRGCSQSRREDFKWSSGGAEFGSDSLQNEKSDPDHR
jgi:hypothetical protein